MAHHDRIHVNSCLQLAIDPHTQFQVPTVIAALKSISYKTLNLAKIAEVRGQWTETYGSS